VGGGASLDVGGWGRWGHRLGHGWWWVERGCDGCIRGGSESETEGRGCMTASDEGRATRHGLGWSY
jgi:hypothetical protein